ncbi:MAG: glycosyltransferase family 2 protein [Tannerellaceae bacterium]
MTALAFQVIELIFIVSLGIVFYTYIGYGLILYVLVKVKEAFVKHVPASLPEVLPDVTLFIAAYNEEDVVEEKMENCRQLSYPNDKLKIVWVTDGTTDRTNQLLASYPDVTVLFEPKRSGKTAALNRGMQYISTPIVVFTDANTMLNKEAITEIVSQFTNEKVGCVAGEKRIMQKEKESATGGEGIYWKYESALKALDYRLYSAVGAAGELFAIRSQLFEQMPADTLLDDFILSLRIAMKGYKIAYCKKAYAIETASLNMQEEEKRKVRIAAGGLQSIWRLRSLLNLFRYGTLSFQYISHRVLRWTITPVLLFLLLPINLVLAFISGQAFYSILLVLQILFYLIAWIGYKMEQRQIHNKLLFVPYYFMFMNINVMRGVRYIAANKGNGAWDKAKRIK